MPLDIVFLFLYDCCSAYEKFVTAKRRAEKAEQVYTHALKAYNQNKNQATKEIANYDRQLEQLEARLEEAKRSRGIQR